LVSSSVETESTSRELEGSPAAESSSAASSLRDVNQKLAPTTKSAAAAIATAAPARGAGARLTAGMGARMEADGALGSEAVPNDSGGDTRRGSDAPDAPDAASGIDVGLDGGVASGDDEASTAAAIEFVPTAGSSRDGRAIPLAEDSCVSLSKAPGHKSLGSSTRCVGSGPAVTGLRLDVAASDCAGAGNSMAALSATPADGSLG
jgi:hypothetical protein